MSYYQMVSLKLQMGLDPDSAVDLSTLMKMWREYSLHGVPPEETLSRLAPRRVSPPARLSAVVNPVH